MNYICQHVLTKSEPQKPDYSKTPPPKARLLNDETLPSFFRRLAWSPDGSFLLVPAGIYKYSSASEAVNTAYIILRGDLSNPSVQIPGANKPVVAVCFCPILFCLQGSNPVVTLNSLCVHDTESVPPIAIYAELHYAAITDIAWSPDAKHLALSSQDGYCTVIEFEMMN